MLLDLSQFLAMYPWLPAHRALGEPLEWFWHHDVAVDIEKLWLHLTDTSRLNRELGFEEAFYQEINGELHGHSYVGSNNLLTRWVELPWAWNYCRFMTNIRVYRRGLLHIWRGVWHLQPLANGQNRIYFYIGIIPVNERAGKGLHRYFSDRIPLYNDVIAQAVKMIKGMASHVYETVPLSLDTDSQTYLQNVQVQLIADGQPPELVQQLITYILTTDVLDLHRLRLVALAHDWGVERNQLVTLCLHAVRVGLLTLSWDVICPHCWNVRTSSASLVQVPAKGDCEVCNIHFENSHEDSLEITFHIHPAIQEIPRRYFCLGTIASKRHIMLQYQLAPQACIQLETSLPVGHYRLRQQGAYTTHALHIKPEETTAYVEWNAGTFGESYNTQPHAHFTLYNPTQHPQTFVIEKVDRLRDALRPVHLFNLQEFRDLFSTETLDSNLYLDIGTQTIVFSDMVGSTRYYDTQGDARAFLRLKEHFTRLFQLVREHKGVVVKTVGDGALLAFAQPLSALQASLAIQEQFTGDLRLRISIHMGACLAVNFNTGIDYFGQTVNLAAKLQNIAEAGEIVLSQTFWEHPLIQKFLTEQGFTPMSVLLQHKTLPTPLPAYKLPATQ